MSQLIIAISKICAAGRNILNLDALDVYIFNNVQVILGRTNARSDNISNWYSRVTRKYFINRYPFVKMTFKEFYMKQMLVKHTSDRYMSTKNSLYLDVKPLHRLMHKNYTKDKSEENLSMLREVAMNMLGVKNPKLRAMCLSGEADSMLLIDLHSAETDIPEGYMDIYELCDWFNSGQAPANLERLSYEEAIRQSEEWHEALARQQEEDSKKSNAELASSLVEATDYKEIYQFNDFRWVSILSEKAATVEGKMMGHCVGGYGRKIVSGSTIILSLWDKDTVNPHVTMEISWNGEKKVWTILQVEGNSNSKPKQVYIPAIHDLIDKLLYLKKYPLLSEAIFNKELNNVDYTARADRHGVFPE